MDKLFYLLLGGFGSFFLFMTPIGQRLLPWNWGHKTQVVEVIRPKPLVNNPSTLRTIPPKLETHAPNSTGYRSLASEPSRSSGEKPQTVIALASHPENYITPTPEVLDEHVSALEHGSAPGIHGEQYVRR